MKLRLTKTTRDFLDALPPKHFRQVVTAIFELLTEPYPHDSKKLKGYPYYRVDFREYRVVYDVHEDEIHVLLAGKRNDDEVYRMLKRLKG